ncbi:D-arabinono-1 [Trypanosoma melophagium]|uniref:D-arabinono-1 n=1 Tax=Trypanosoma melophagium TaxID=715481 RepID=UPI00351AA178|nr:D-arabinono-1 [Trypanosoma melophagium]
MGSEPNTAAGWANAARIGCCYPARHHHPPTAEAAAAVVRGVREAGGRLRVAGAGRSPNACVYTSGHILHADRLNRIIRVDPQRRQIVCEGGALLADVFNALDAHGLMLRCVPSVVNTTIAGAIATATHGSGNHTRSLSDYVVSLTLIDGTGTFRTFDAAENEIPEETDTTNTNTNTNTTKTTKTTTAAAASELPLVACHLGMLGVVVRVTLQAEQRRTWRLRSAPVHVRDLIQGDTLEKRVSGPDFYRFFWMPNTEMCYESIGDCIDSNDDAEKVTESTEASNLLRKKPLEGVQATSQHVVGKRQDTDIQGEMKQKKRLCVQISDMLKGNWLRHGVLEAALAAATYYPSMQPYINRAYQKIYYATPTVQYGNSIECFTFDCLFKQWACEWAIDARDALKAFKVVRDLIATEKLSVHFPVEFRFTDADRTALSPAHGRKTCWVGIVMYRPYLLLAPDTMRYYQAFSDAMTAMGGRPHWAKYYTWGPEQLKRSYGKNWEDFLALRKRLDPDDIFVNGWWKSLSGQGPLINSTTSHL